MARGVAIFNWLIVATREEEEAEGKKRRRKIVAKRPMLRRVILAMFRVGRVRLENKQTVVLYQVLSLHEVIAIFPSLFSFSVIVLLSLLFVFPVPAGSPSRGGNATVYVPDIN